MKKAISVHVDSLQNVRSDFDMIDWRGTELEEKTTMAELVKKLKNG